MMQSTCTRGRPKLPMEYRQMGMHPGDRYTGLIPLLSGLWWHQKRLPGILLPSGTNRPGLFLWTGSAKRRFG